MDQRRDATVGGVNDTSNMRSNVAAMTAKPSPGKLNAPVYRCVDCGRMLEDSHTPTCPWGDAPASPFPRDENMATGTTPEQMRALAAEEQASAEYMTSLGFATDQEDAITAALRAAADEMDRLRAVLEDAPHMPACSSLSPRVGFDCDCWKAGAL